MTTDPHARPAPDPDPDPLRGSDPLPRFCAYAVLRNLRLFDPFLVLFLIADLGLDFAAVGLVIAWQKGLLAALEVPLAVVADRFGRRRTLVASFTIAALAMLALFAASAAADPLWPVLGALALYAVGEALRTGTHKAIILDWLTRRDERRRKVQVIGTARFYSKASAGAAALLGGALVWLTGRYGPLFAASAVPTALCALLVARYPRALDDRPPPAPPARARRGLGARLSAISSAMSRPGLLAVVVPSVLFESQVKLAGAWLQPALAHGIEGLDLAVAGGVGAMLYGIWHLASGLFAGSAALFSSRLVGWAGGPRRALAAAHLLAAIVLGLTSAGFAGGWLGPGLALMLGLAALQNARRPIFVAAIDDVMDPRWRATTLSVESQARAIVHALTAATVGVIAEYAGLGFGFALMAALVGLAAVGSFLPQTPGSARRPDEKE